MSIDRVHHIVYGNPYQGVSHTPAQGRSGTRLRGGQAAYLYVWRWRPGFFLKNGSFHGQSVTDLPSPGWTGINLDTYGLISGGVDNNCWKRFGDVDIEMTCTPDPATSTFIGGVPVAGTGVSKHSLILTCNAYVPTVTTVTNAATSGSGLDAPAASAFPLYKVTDTFVINSNTSGQFKITETIQWGWTGDGGAGTVYFTTVLVGDWHNGRLASTMASDCYSIYTGLTAGSMATLTAFTRDSSGAVVQLSNGLGASGDDLDPTDNSTWSVPADYQRGKNYGYWTTEPLLADREIHIFAGNDFIPYGPFVTSGGHAAGTFTWSIKKYAISLAGIQAAPSTVASPTLYANDRYVKEADGTFFLYIPTGDIDITDESGVSSPLLTHF